MSARKTNVPAIPSIGRSQNEIDLALKALKEATEVGYGRRGDPLDRFVTLRELKDSGLASIGIGGGGGASITGPGGGGGGDGAPIFDPGPVDFGDTDFSVPPAPTGVSARGIPPNSMMVTWDPPNYSNHRFAEIFCLLEHEDGSAATLDELQADLASALVGTADGTIFMHRDLTNVRRDGQDDLDAALNPAVRYYWVRFVSFADIRGPLAPLNGASAAMAIDPGSVLDAMITNARNTAIYHNLRGWFDGDADNPILAAGGVRNFINQQDNLIIGDLNTLEAIVGTNEPGDPNISLYAWVRSINATATANSASLNDIQTWQAALSLAAAGEGDYQYYTITQFITESSQQVAFDIVHIGVPAPFSAGDSARLAAPAGGDFAAANGISLDVIFVETITSTAQRVHVARTASNTTLLPINTVSDFSGANANTRLGKFAPNTTPTDFVDFIASVQHNIFVSVDPDTAIAQEIGIVSARIGDVEATNVTQNTAIAEIDGRLTNIWSVRMQQQVNGLFYTAGFGLSLETIPEGDGTDPNAGNTISQFMVNANQFAVMGPSSPGALVVGYHRLTTTRARIYLYTAAHGFVVAPAEGATGGTIMIPDGGSLTYIDPETDIETDLGNPLQSVRGKEFTVVATGSDLGIPTVDIEFTDSGNTFPVLVTTSRYLDPTLPQYNRTLAEKLNYALFPLDNIPFLIDTQRNVVGIRGTLVVNGLIVADAGQFTELTAQTAFVQQLQAEVVNANVVIGQRLIAGTPGTGALTPGAYNAISNYIIEMNNPTSNQYPLRYWKPSSGHMAFGLDQQANIFIGGNMSVGGNATIATTPASTNVISIGGSGAGNEGEFCMWVGPKTQYGVGGNLRTEANGLFWIKANGRAGFNSDLFLGSGALALPSVAAQSESNPNPGSTYTKTGSTIRADTNTSVAVSRNTIRIRADRDGAVAPTVVTVSGFLVAFGTPGGGDDKFFQMTAELIGSQDPNAPPVSGGLIQQFIQDDYRPECMPFSLSNVLQVPAGNYYVRLKIETYEDKPMSIIKGWNVVAMQVGA